MINTDIKLQKPEKYYGAIYTRKTPGYSHWIIIWLITTLLLTSSILFIAMNALTSNLFVPILFLVALSLLFPFFVVSTILVFTYNKEAFKYELVYNRTQYAYNVFKTWVEQKHGIEINPEQSLELMNGKKTIITKNGKEYEIYLKPTLESQKLFTTGSYQETEKFHYKNWDYDTDKIDLQLLFKKQQKPAKEKAWR